MDVFRTVLAGTLVLVVGQVLIKFFVEPWQDYRELVGRIAHATILYRTANADPGLASPVPVEEARRELRSLAGELWQRTYAIPFYAFICRVCWWIPTLQEIQDAASGLIGLSNSFSSPHLRSGYVTKIRQGLHLYDPDAPAIDRLPLCERLTGRFRTSK